MALKESAPAVDDDDAGEDSAIAQDLKALEFRGKEA